MTSYHTPLSNIGTPTLHVPPQVPVWSVWTVTVEVPAPLTGQIGLTLVRNQASRDPHCNYLVFVEVAERLRSYGAAVSDRALHERLKRRPRLKTLRVTDPMLLGRLKALSVIGPNTSAVKLTSCAAMHAALRCYPSLAAVAAIVRGLRFTAPTHMATSAFVGPRQLRKAAAIEARLPVTARRRVPIQLSAPEAIQDAVQRPSRASTVATAAAPATTAATPTAKPTTSDPSLNRTPASPTATAAGLNAVGMVDLHATGVAGDGTARASQPASRGAPRSAPVRSAEATTAATAATASQPRQPAQSRHSRLPTAAAQPVTPPPGPAVGSSSQLGVQRPMAADRCWVYPKDGILPDRLPNIVYSEDTIKARRIGIFEVLKRHCASIPLMAELGPLKVWCLQPFNFNEDSGGPLNESTYRGLENTVSKLVGFAYMLMGAPLPYLSLRLFSNAVSVAWVGPTGDMDAGVFCSTAGIPCGHSTPDSAVPGCESGV